MRKITERIKTFEDAYSILKEKKHPFVDNYDKEDTSDTGLRAAHQLRIIVEALNEGWKPEFTGDEKRYYPCFYPLRQEEFDVMDEEMRQYVVLKDNRYKDYCGFFVGARCIDNSFSDFICLSEDGSYFPLCLKNEELAYYCGKQFAELWRDFKFYE